MPQLLRGEGIDDVLADCRHVAGRRGDHLFVAGRGELGDGDPAVLMVRTTLDEASPLQPPSSSSRAVRS
ncbi:hypothetical protein [Kribbella sancticallisti]|uniref:hypothetical protein n=1 Tax=Kribbella sancticallisti TaxID=460087 RepID=UPI0031DAAF7B